mmetsp:Transcript_9571/g.15113  ORF Transcript_9571/g.15113 Transcript_9571/m.15113 type:complete len:216 (-) Transcript_9571:742-1389(-)
MLECTPKQCHVSRILPTVETLLPLCHTRLVDISGVASNRGLAFLLDLLLVGSITLPRDKVEPWSIVLACLIGFERYFHLVVRCHHVHSTYKALFRRVEEVFLQSIQNLRRPHGNLAQSHRLLPLRSNAGLEHASAFLDVPRPELDAERHPLPFPFKVLGAVSNVVPIVHLHPQPCALEIRHQLVQSIVQRFLSFLVVLFRGNRHDHHLHRRHTRG